MTIPRILIVDDEPILSWLVSRFLEKTQRFEVRVENRPALALTVARTFRPDLVLLDVNMPGKDGGEIAREIESDPVLHRTQIVFLTSLVSPAEAGGGAKLQGGYWFLPKPVNPQLLIETVDRLLVSEFQAA